MRRVTRRRRPESDHYLSKISSETLMDEYEIEIPSEEEFQTLCCVKLSMADGGRYPDAVSDKNVFWADGPYKMYENKSNPYCTISMGPFFSAIAHLVGGPTNYPTKSNCCWFRIDGLFNNERAAQSHAATISKQQRSAIRIKHHLLTRQGCGGCHTYQPKDGVPTGDPRAATRRDAERNPHHPGSRAPSERDRHGITET